MFQFKLREKIVILQRLICHFLYLYYVSHGQNKGLKDLIYMYKRKINKQTKVGYSLGCNHLNMGIEVKAYIACVIILILPLRKIVKKKKNKQNKQQKKKTVVHAAAVVRPQPRSRGY